MQREWQYQLQIATLRGDLKDKCKMLDASIAAQETLQAAIVDANRVKRDAINELCNKCGKYREEHNGACDGCRWHHGKA